MNKKVYDRKTIARKRIRGLLIFLIILFLFVLIYDVYCVIESRF